MSGGKYIYTYINRAFLEFPGRVCKLCLGACQKWLEKTQWIENVVFNGFVLLYSHYHLCSCGTA